MTRPAQHATRDAQLLALFDAGHAPVAISRALALHTWTVYAVLRRERAGRKRSPRSKTSAVPEKVAGLYGAGVSVVRIADLLGISTAYVYNLLQTERERNVRRYFQGRR